jgi:pimeloyl-ACP methyl ester carboxylesterase
VRIQTVDVFFSLESGAGWWGGQPNPTPIVASFFNSLLASGHQIILARWNGAWYGTSPQLPIGLLAESCRPATVIQGLAQHYPAPSFNVIGTSAGGAAIAYAMADYSVSVNKAVIDSGPPFMELRAGCENVPGYELSVPGKSIVDSTYGYSSNGPCVSGNRQFETQWNRDSVESGADFSYPGTAVHVIIGMNDDDFIQNRGMDYYALLLAHGQNAQYHAIPQMGHGVTGSQTGLNTLAGILLQ